MKSPLTGTAFLALSLLLSSACSSPGTSSSTADLTVEEHRLVEAPSTEPLAFKPVQGSMDQILALHAAERARGVPDESLLIDGHHALRLSLGSEVLTATEYHSPDGSSGWVAVSRDGGEIYQIDTGMASPITGLQGLWTYDDHWALETAYITAESFGGRLSLDGALVVPGGGVDEAFDFQLLQGKPFYFLSRLGRIGFHYDGREVPSGYDEVPHYQCCSASVLNPLHAEDMLAFFARRGAVWYYVEIGAFSD